MSSTPFPGGGGGGDLDCVIHTNETSKNSFQNSRPIINNKITQLYSYCVKGVMVRGNESVGDWRSSSRKSAETYEMSKILNLVP